MDRIEANTVMATEQEDSEEEEMLIYADFDMGLPYEELEEPNVHIKFIGIDSENPRIQINDRFFKGTYEHAVGTNVFFAEDDNPPMVDEIYQKNPDKFYKCLGKTDKVLKFQRILVAPKENPDEIVTEEPEDQTKYDIHKTYEQALNQFLSPGEQPPRRIPHDMNGEHLIKRKKKLKDIGSDNDETDDDFEDEDYLPPFHA